MPEVPESSIVDVRQGAKMVGALMVGTREIYVRFEKYTYESPGNFTFTLPDWATGYGVVMSGGGGGGQAGSGATGNRGNGGQGGKVTGIWGRLSNSNNMVMSGVVGAGGAGGTTSLAYGQNGGATSITTHTSNNYTAAGGIANPTMPSYSGGVSTMTFTDLFYRYINATPGSTYTNGPGGTNNGAPGTRGGGGAGGDGGVFGNFNKGGKGGNGYVEIYVWGLPRHQGGTEKISLGTGYEARDQLRSALSARGYDYQTVEYIPFDIEFIGTGSAKDMFRDCAALTSAPDMDTSQVTDMNGMFENCAALTYVPDLQTSNVADVSYMFWRCTSLTDGNVRLIGKKTGVATASAIGNSGLTRVPFYNTSGNPI